MSRASSVFSGGMSPTTDPRGREPVMTISSSSLWSSGGAAFVFDGLAGCAWADDVAPGD
jgi:hypothetical protein